MNFASFQFWEILLITSLVMWGCCWILRYLIPNKTDFVGKIAVLVLSLTLLASESLETLAVFVWVIVMGYLGLRNIFFFKSNRCKNLYIAFVVIVQIAPLFYYKYSNFIFGGILGLDWARQGVLIPMGLSFYTFQMIGMTVDTAAGNKRLPRAIDFLNFASFFPQIVAGPIERRSDLLPQVEKIQYQIQRSRLSDAISWVILGFFYKLVIADNLALAFDRMDINSNNAFHVWSECAFFGLRIYFDFAGYSFIAMGLAQIFGIDLTLNFRSPYLVQNIQEFWRHWHVTLSQWFRDYIYIPMGGSRSKRWIFNVMVVFIVSGIWHGAGWNFIVWGVLHGIGIIIASKLPTEWIPRPLAWCITMLYVFFAWLFFYESRMPILWQKASSVLSFSAYSGQNLFDLSKVYISNGEFINSAFLVTIASACLLLEWWSCRKGGEYYSVLRKFSFSVLMVILIVLLSPSEKSGFIYFNF